MSTRDQITGEYAAVTAFTPVAKQSLADRLARRIKRSIQDGQYRAGDQLPPIVELARRFRVGHPTVREALQKLEMVRLVEIRHGSGVFVRTTQESLVVASPTAAGTASEKQLDDVLAARVPLEIEAVAHAARQATDAHLIEMRRVLAEAARSGDDERAFSTADAAFHRQIALASGNVVLLQLLDALRVLFADEMRELLTRCASVERDTREHWAILDAIERRDDRLAVERMRQHLMTVRDALASRGAA